LENLAQPPKQRRKPSNCDFARAIKKALQALRRFEPLPEAVRPLADLLLEYSYASERTFVYVKHQKTFALTLDLDKSAITRGLDWMESKRIIVRAGGYYAFHAGLFLRINERQDPDRTQLELLLDRPDCQPFFPREVNLNDQQVETILAPVEPGSTTSPRSAEPVDPGSTGVERPATPVEPGSTALAKVEPGSTQALSSDAGQGRPLAFAVAGVMNRIGARVEPDSTRSQLASATTVPSTRSSKLAEPAGSFIDAMQRQWPATTEAALEFLELLNTQQGDNPLRKPQWAHKWTKLAAAEPSYIVGHLRRKLLKQMHRDSVVSKPLGLIFSIAACDRKL
jgi:hypothetical protein